MALAIESQNVTRRILENHELNALILQVGLRVKTEDIYVGKTFPAPDSRVPVKKMKVFPWRSSPSEHWASWQC